MSGGSFDYLCFAKAEDIANKREQLRSMTDYLLSLGYDDVAKETQYVIELIDQYQTIMECKIEKLKDIWHDAEWICSGDGADIKTSVANYRNLGQKK